MPMELLWDTNGGLLVLPQLYDWDSLVLVADVTLPARLVLCTDSLPCQLTLLGNSRRVHRDVDGVGAFVCLASNGCTGINLDGVRFICSQVATSESLITAGGGLSLDVSNSSFKGCSSAGAGSAILAYGGVAVRINGSMFLDLRSYSSGGAISVVGGSLDIASSTFTNCSASDGGGAVFGGAFTCYGADGALGTQMQLDGVLFNDCESSGSGGAIQV